MLSEKSASQIIALTMSAFRAVSTTTARPQLLHSKRKKGIAIPQNRAHSEFTVNEHLEYLLTVLVDAIDKILNLRAIGGFL